MALLLAVAVTLCAVCITILLAYNHQLHATVDSWKSAHIHALCETREWESKYWGVVTDTADPADAPPSHNVPDIDVDEVMSGSDDPVWNIVIDCRSVGVMGEWLNSHPEIAEQQPHRQYGEFATFILGLPEDEQSVAGVARAVRA